ncbi:MAG: nitroreductase family protein [Bacteroidota bacterium]
MKEFYVNNETCSRCGICADVCPAMVLEKDSSGMVRFKPDYIHLCLGCGQCMAVCNTKSVFAKGMLYEKDFFEFTDTDPFFSLLEQRRSVRRFKPKPVSNEELEKILYAVSQAPHGDSHHHVEVTVINDRNKIIEALPLMSQFFNKLGKWLHNPIMRSIIKFKKGKDTLNTLTNHLLPRIEKGIYQDYSFEYDGITRGAHTLLIFHAHKDSEEHNEDSYIFVTYATLAAQALGLGSTIIGLVPAAINKSKELKKIFNIPADHDAVVSLIAGYPKYKYKKGIKRELKKVNWEN